MPEILNTQTSHNKYTNKINNISQINIYFSLQIIFTKQN